MKGNVPAAFTRVACQRKRSDLCGSWLAGWLAGWLPVAANPPRGVLRNGKTMRASSYVTRLLRRRGGGRGGRRVDNGKAKLTRVSRRAVISN